MRLDNDATYLILSNNSSAGLKGFGKENSFLQKNPREMNPSSNLLDDWSVLVDNYRELRNSYH